MPDYGISSWTQEPSDDEWAQFQDMMDIVHEIDSMTSDEFAPRQQWRVNFPSGNSVTFPASREAANDIGYGWDIHPVSSVGEARFTDPNYQFTDEDLVEFDVPRERYESYSNPPRTPRRPLDLPQPEKHRVDVRPRRRGPRMPREQ